MKELKKYNFLIIGLGSMGKRRIRNLLHHGINKNNIYGFNPTQKRCTEVNNKFGIKAVTDFQKVLKNSNPDVFIISTPPNKHGKYLKYALKNNIHFFCRTSN